MKTRHLAAAGPRPPTCLLPLSTPTLQGGGDLQEVASRPRGLGGTDAFLGGEAVGVPGRVALGHGERLLPERGGEGE